MKLRLELTETIPEEIEEGVLYVSFKYWTTVHKCACGCGQKVVLRLSPKHWAITLNGESVSMYPSVGNWQLPCRSHYWIEEGRILHARRWSDGEIARNRAMTKGQRTPLQTPRSRLLEFVQAEDSADTQARQSVPDIEDDAGADIGEVGGSPVLSSGRDKDAKKGISTGWWSTATKMISRAWRKALNEFGNSRGS